MDSTAIDSSKYADQFSFYPISPSAENEVSNFETKYVAELLVLFEILVTSHEALIVNGAGDELPMSLAKLSFD